MLYFRCCPIMYLFIIAIHPLAKMQDPPIVNAPVNVAVFDESQNLPAMMEAAASVSAKIPSVVSVHTVLRAALPLATTGSNAASDLHLTGMAKALLGTLEKITGLLTALPLNGLREPNGRLIVAPLCHHSPSADLSRNGLCDGPPQSQCSFCSNGHVTMRSPDYVKLLLRAGFDQADLATACDCLCLEDAGDPEGAFGTWLGLAPSVFELLPWLEKHRLLLDRGTAVLSSSQLTSLQGHHVVIMQDCKLSTEFARCLELQIKCVDATHVADDLLRSYSHIIMVTASPNADTEAASTDMTSRDCGLKVSDYLTCKYGDQEGRDTVKAFVYADVLGDGLYVKYRQVFFGMPLSSIPTYSMFEMHGPISCCSLDELAHRETATTIASRTMSIIILVLTLTLKCAERRTSPGGFLKGMSLARCVCQTCAWLSVGHSLCASCNPNIVPAFIAGRIAIFAFPSGSKLAMLFNTSTLPMGPFASTRHLPRSLLALVDSYLPADMKHVVLLGPEAAVKDANDHVAVGKQVVAFRSDW